MKEIDKICLGVEHGRENDYMPVSPEIVQTSSFQFKDFQHYVRVNSENEFAYTYSRGGNPTTTLLEEKIAKLEGADEGRVFASGMGAISGTVLSLVQQGDHIIVVNTVYGSSVKMINGLAKFGVECTKIDVETTKEIFDYIKENTKMIYFESPSSQKFEMLDLEMISEVARKKGIYTVIDNTWSTPIFQNPLKHGIDVVIHSCSKYIGGHSDIVGGVVVTSHEIMQKIDKFAPVLLGATMTPMNAWLALRGLRTMPVRLKAHEETVKKVITFLQTQPNIEKIYHPLCASLEQQNLAKRYLNGYGSLLGIVLKNADTHIIETFVDSLEHFTLAYSWGGFESLVMPVFKGDNEEELKQRNLSKGHFRMYLGLEDPELLIEDIQQALEKAYQ